jgi:hypothetical protein
LQLLHRANPTKVSLATVVVIDVPVKTPFDALVVAKRLWVSTVVAFASSSSMTVQNVLHAPAGKVAVIATFDADTLEAFHVSQNAPLRLVVPLVSIAV